MTTRRSDIVDAAHPGVYHCISRCVRRQSLIDDPGRREWVVSRLEFLAGLMAVDVVAFAVMRNHVHLLLAIRPDVVAQWTDAEVAARRVALLPNLRARRRAGVAPGSGPTEAEVSAIRASPALLASARRDLCSLGFLHRLLKEPCARIWNRQERVTGHFWEGRFKSPRVLDLEGLVAVARYIELNEVHAAAEPAIPASGWTSASWQWRRVAEETERVVAAEGDGTGSVESAAAILAERILAAEWRPVFPCSAAPKFAPGAKPTVAGTNDRPRRPGRPTPQGWREELFGEDFGPGDPRGGLLAHVEGLDLSGRRRRPDKRGWISALRASALGEAVAAGVLAGGGCAELGRALEAAVRSRLAVEGLSLEPLVYRDMLVTSRGSCYGGAESVALEAARRGRERLWVGFLRRGEDGDIEGGRAA